jgi:hypothetical protein
VKTLHLRQLVEKQVGKVTNQEMQFAVTNLNLEIEYKFQRIPTTKEMKQILVSNIKFYRNHKNIIVEG